MITGCMLGKLAFRVWCKKIMFFSKRDKLKMSILKKGVMIKTPDLTNHTHAWSIAGHKPFYLFILIIDYS